MKYIKSKFPCYFFLNLLVFFLIIINFPCFTCTVFNSTKGKTTLVDNNLDWYLTSSRVWFTPPFSGKHGWVGFGFHNDYPNYPEDGMNDQRLFFTWALLSQRTDFTLPHNKPNFNCYAPVKILEECATVDDVIRYYQAFNEPLFKHEHIM